jgi:predicted metal-binding membrane protein
MTAAARERWRVRLPVVIVSAGAWAVLGTVPEALFPHVHDGVVAPVAARSAGWAVMLAAMMLPLLIAPLRHVRDRSFARRRARAATLFLVGYAAVWMIAGAILVPSGLAAGRSGTLFGFVLAVALAWQCSPARQHCVNRGHAHPPLAPDGVGADLAILRFGVGHGGWCVGSCWAVMLLALCWPGAHLAAMAGASIWLLAERMDGPERPRWRFPYPARAGRALAASPAWFGGRAAPLAAGETFQA